MEVKEGNMSLFPVTGKMSPSDNSIVLYEAREPPLNVNPEASCN